MPYRIEYGGKAASFLASMKNRARARLIDSIRRELEETPFLPASTRKRIDTAAASAELPEVSTWALDMGKHWVTFDVYKSEQTVLIRSFERT